MDLDVAIRMDDVALMDDMIPVTKDGYENLSGRAPRTVEDVERIMGVR